jgi:hypothetical protein
LRSQTVPAEQFPFEVHATHAFVVLSHAGVGAVHAIVSVDEHWTHSPPTQAGTVVVGHAPDAGGAPV